MTTRKSPDRGGSDTTWRISCGPARLRILLALPVAAAAAAALTACSSAGASAPSSSGKGTGSPAAAAANTVKTAEIGGVTVLTNSNGFTLYSFAPDMPTTSKCNGTCAQNWPPVKGPVTGAGLTGTFGTIKRSDGSVQATFDLQPLYTFAGAPRAEQWQRPEHGRRPVARITTSGSAPAGNSLIGCRRRLRVLRPAAPSRVED